MPTIEKLYISIMSGTQDRNNINIQPNGNMAKPYQVKQVRNYLSKYRLSL